MAVSESALLEIRGLEVGPPDTPLLEGVDLRLVPGECCALLGPSGAGKSLLLRSLAGLEPARWSEARLRGRAIEDLMPQERRRGLLYLHQEPVRFEGTARQNLERVRTLAGARPEPWKLVEEWLDRLGLNGELLERPMTTLSGGEALRLALVRALQMRPSVALLDEPTAPLDPSAAGRVEELVRRWRKEESGRAVVWSVHTGELARRAGERFLVLAEGRARHAGESADRALAELAAASPQMQEER